MNAADSSMRSKQSVHQTGCYITTCPIARASESQFRTSIFKDQEVTVAQIGQAESVLWTYMTFNTQKITLFHLGGSKKNFGQEFLSNSYFICPNGQVVIKTYVAP